mmetsp:Transcript_46484/g.85178  ORF Transcript_46484/g.85178 Transcript_46484/m.85178 type:complete len:379 (-) Transcript_46484:86-1222(-)
MQCHAERQLHILQLPSVVRLFVLVTSLQLFRAEAVSVSAMIAGADDTKIPPALLNSRKYLFASIPHSRQVVYCNPPDNVWRPVVISNVTTPGAIAVDSLHSRLFIADAPEAQIYWYSIRPQANGHLRTSGVKHVAVHGYVANWIAVNGQGDLYFTGHEVVKAPESVYDAIFRQDVAHIERGNALDVTEVYARSNSGVPTPRVYKPSGISVDTFYIFWGNSDEGLTAGSLNKASRMNIETKIQVMNSLSLALSEVTGVQATNSYVYFAAQDGVHGLEKNTDPASDEVPADTLIAGPPVDPSQDWDPKTLAWDGGGTLYLSDPMNGKVYEVPGNDLSLHNMTVFADLVGVHGLGTFEIQDGVVFDEEGTTRRRRNFLSTW